MKFSSELVGVVPKCFRCCSTTCSRHCFCASSFELLLNSATSFTQARKNFEIWLTKLSKYSYLILYKGKIVMHIAGFAAYNAKFNLINNVKFIFCALLKISWSKPDEVLQGQILQPHGILRATILLLIII